MAETPLKEKRPAEFRQCKRCNAVKEFYHKRSVCKECYKKEHRLYNKKYYVEHAKVRLLKIYV